MSKIFLVASTLFTSSLAGCDLKNYGAGFEAATCNGGRTSHAVGAVCPQGGLDFGCGCGEITQSCECQCKGGTIVGLGAYQGGRREEVEEDDVITCGGFKNQMRCEEDERCDWRREYGRKFCIAKTLIPCESIERKDDCKSQVDRCDWSGAILQSCHTLPQEHEIPCGTYKNKNPCRDNERCYWKHVNDEMRICATKVEYVDCELIFKKNQCLAQERCDWRNSAGMKWCTTQKKLQEKSEQEESVSDGLRRLSTQIRDASKKMRFEPAVLAALSALEQHAEQ